MPRWVPRAIVLLWLGFLGTILIQELWDRLFGFFLLLVISLFLALAIEPGTNRLARRGMRRGVATGLILAVVAVVVFGFIAVMGALVADQANELAENRDDYVTDVVAFLNDNFGANLEAAEIIDSIDDPQGPVREFLNSQADRAVKLGVTAFGTLFQAFSILLFTFYLAADGPRLRRVGACRAKDRWVSFVACHFGGGVIVFALDCVPSHRHTSPNCPGVVGRCGVTVLASHRYLCGWGVAAVTDGH